MERNSAAARHSWARQHACLLLSFFPFPVGHPMSAGCSAAIWCSCCSKLALFESARWQRHWPFDQWPFTWLLLICRASLKFRLNRRLAAPSIRTLFGLPPASNLLHLFLSKTRPHKVCHFPRWVWTLSRSRRPKSYTNGCHKQAKKSKFYTG